MKFDARADHDPDRRNVFIKWLVGEAASGLRRSAGDMESLRSVVFLYLNRAYEAGLDSDEICDLLGILRGSVLNEARLSQRDQQVVLDAYETLDPILEQQYQGGQRNTESS
jgi:hypothetical protein